jgi:hypothetical protein
LKNDSQNSSHVSIFQAWALFYLLSSPLFNRATSVTLFNLF